MAENRKLPFEDGRSRPVWLDPNEAQTVRAINTKYGNRLLIGMRDSGVELWLDDTPEAREKLGVA